MHKLVHSVTCIFNKEEEEDEEQQQQNDGGGDDDDDYADNDDNDNDDGDDNDEEATLNTRQQQATEHHSPGHYRCEESLPQSAGLSHVTLLQHSANRLSGATKLPVCHFGW